MPEAEFDRAKAKAFTQLMVRHLEGAAVSVMLEIGRRVGLFEAMARMAPATSAVIAEQAGLNERYVREWLAAMSCGGIVEYAAAERTYRPSTRLGSPARRPAISRAWWRCSR